MSGRVLHGRLHQHVRGTLVERTPGKVSRQQQIESIRPFPIGHPPDRTHFVHRHIHAGRFHLNFRIVHRVAEEVIGANRAVHVVSRPVAVLRLLAFFGEVHGHFEFR